MVMSMATTKGGGMAPHGNTVSASDFKAHCLEIMNQVQSSRHEVVVTKRGRPVVKVTPVDDRSGPIFGCMKGTAIAKGDIFSTGEQWEADK